MTPQQLLQVLEHAVAATAPGATPGQFAQIGGIAFSVRRDAARRRSSARTTARDHPGNRIVSAALIDENGR